MVAIPDSLLAIDIETASPFRNPDSGSFDNTACFELVAVGVGYQAGPEEPIQTEVFFRKGGWDAKWTAMLLEQVTEWCSDHQASATLTYNGSKFDEIHLKTWAKEIEYAGLWNNAVNAISSLFDSHIDLNTIAVNKYQNRIENWRTAIKLEQLCQWENITVSDTQYLEYSIGDLPNSEEIEGEYVTNVHVGTVLGEAYVEQIIKQSSNQELLPELQRLLYDYTVSDIEPLFKLARNFSDDSQL